MEMIDATTAKKVLPSLKIPYLFFSNINELHFDALSRTLPLPKFAKRHSLLSHQVGYLKPARHIFSALRETVARTASSALYVDDKQENLRQGHRIGLRTAHCPRPEVLGDVLRQFSLI
jgi:FMN phosphatase YigB (HAD superfamily)